MAMTKNAKYCLFTNVNGQYNTNKNEGKISCFGTEQFTQN